MQKQTIFITGMTCTGCEKSVKKAFESLAHVANVISNHQTGEVEINANQYITIDEITAILPKKFALIDETPKQPSKLKQLFPLFLIFGFIGSLAIPCYLIAGRRYAQDKQSLERSIQS